MVGPLITVDGGEIGIAHEKDPSGRSLPFWQGCHVMGRSEIFLRNPHEPASLDGRYFGPLPIASIAGLAEPHVRAGPIMWLERSTRRPVCPPCRHSSGQHHGSHALITACTLTVAPKIIALIDATAWDVEAVNPDILAPAP